MADNPLTREVAGRPVWQWGALAAAGVGLGLLFTRVTAKNNEPGATVDQAAGVSGNLPGIPANRLAAVTQVPGVDEESSSGPRTNAQWAIAASARVAQSLGADPFAVEQALSKYLVGRDVTSAERGVISEAIRLLGAPPEGSPVVGVIADPPPPVNLTPTVPPSDVAPNNGKDVVFSLPDFGGSIEKAALHFYGDPAKWRNFRVYDPNGNPGEGWINDQSYRELATGGLAPTTKLVAGPTDRIAD